MNIEYIEYYIKVDEHQSLNHASKLLNISTQRLVRELSVLKNTLKVTCFIESLEAYF